MLFYSALWNIDETLSVKIDEYNYWKYQHIESINLSALNCFYITAKFVGSKLDKLFTQI